MQGISSEAKYRLATAGSHQHQARGTRQEDEAESAKGRSTGPILRSRKPHGPAYPETKLMLERLPVAKKEGQTWFSLPHIF